MAHDGQQNSPCENILNPGSTSLDYRVILEQTKLRRGVDFLTAKMAHIGVGGVGRC